MKNIVLLSVLFTHFLFAQLAYSEYFSTMVPLGTIKGANVTYKDNDTVTITTGYGECYGEYWEITSETDYDMTSLETDADFHYIYIDDSASSYPTPTITDNTVEPSWSDSKQGWYNGDDRCIGAVWSPADDDIIAEFGSFKDNRYIYDDSIKELFNNGAPNNNWQTCSPSAATYNPVNSIGIYVFAKISYPTDNPYDCVEVQVAALENDNCKLLNMAYQATCVYDWIQIERGWSRNLQWKGQYHSSTLDDNFTIQVLGYEIER